MQGAVAVLGDSDFVMPFSTLGMDTFPVTNNDADIIGKAKKIIEDRYTLIIVAENIAPKAQEIFSAKENTPVPCVVVVPFTTESKGFATQALGEVLKMATGINILQSS